MADDLFINRIYQELTDGHQTDEDLLIGVIAYGIYKEGKREWALELWEREGRKPNHQELEAYIRTWTNSRLDGVREQAAQTLASYANDVINGVKPAIRESAIAGKISADLAEFKASTGLTPRRVIESVVLSIMGAAIWTLILFLIVVTLKFAGVDILQVAETACS